MTIEHPDAFATEQKKLLQYLNNLLGVAEEGKAVNPFKEAGPERVTLDTVEVMNPMNVEHLREASNTGKSLFNNLVRNRKKMLQSPY